MEDCVSAVGETVRLARNNPHTNIFTEVDNNNNINNNNNNNHRDPLV